MSAQAASALLLKVRDSTEAPYVTVAGLRARTISLSAKPVDATHAESHGRWREFLDESGARAIHVEGEGVFANAGADMLLNAKFLSGQQTDCQIIVPSFGAFHGYFVVTELAYLGHEEGEMQWRLALQSSGVVGFDDA
jgi:TP901-1 family phage major tail protein